MKRALLIGINYIGTDNELAGCINDVRNMRAVLMNQFGYEQKNTVMLTDRTAIPATKANILEQLNKIIYLTNKDNGELFIHYSGHGSYTIDRSRDEKDGRDEMLVPMDFADKGMIIDDDLHLLLTKLNSNTKCIMIFDCCHSGTIADLPYCYKKGLLYRENRTSDIKSNIIMISGCRDDQTSADTVIGGEPAGALTGTLLNILKNSRYTVTTNTVCNLLWSLLRSSGYTQCPVLSSSREIKLEHFLCKDKQLLPPPLKTRTL
jgi:hypothetical protein